jgi:hypothetical protein
MSQPQFSQFSLDERARAPLRCLSQTVMMVVMWVMMRKLLAPLVGLRVINPVEAFYNLFWSVFQAVMTSSAPAVAGGSSSVGPAVQLMFSITLWMFPLGAALFGTATIWMAVGYGIDRVAGPPAVADAGGEV